MAPTIAPSSRRSIPEHLIRAAALAVAILCAGSPDAAADSAGPGILVAQIADADGDGIADADDKCPGPIPGTGETDSTGCPAVLHDIYAGLVFEDETHRQWYERFWTNDCSGLPWFSCWTGEHWFEAIDRALSKLPADRHPEVRFAMWRLGRLVGHEWARENDARVIHSREHLSPWYGRLDGAAAADVERTIADIESRAREILNGR